MSAALAPRRGLNKHVTKTIGDNMADAIAISFIDPIIQEAITGSIVEEPEN